MYEKQKGHAHVKGEGGHSEALPPSFLKSQLLEESVFRRRANNNPVVCRPKSAPDRIYIYFKNGRPLLLARGRRG